MSEKKTALADGFYSFFHPTDVPVAIAMRYTGHYKEGLRNGLWKVFHGDGSLAWEVTWENGEWHGPAVTWWQNGVKRQAGNYAMGRQTGLWSFWFDNGQLAACGDYEDDRKVGEWEYLDIDGSPMSSGEWQKKFEQFDWAYDDYTGFPRGANWPVPPPGAEPMAED